MKRLSLVFFVHDLDVQVGGMERQAAQLAQHFVQRGHDVRVVSWPKAEVGVQRPRRELRQGVELLRFVSRQGLPPAVSDELMTLEMAYELRGERPDVLYAVHYRGAVHACALRDLLGAPVAVKLACSGHFGDFQTLSRLEDSAGAGALQEAERLVCLNAEVEAEALAAGVPEDRLERIRNGVEVERYAEAAPLSRAALDLSETDRPFLFVGRLARQKRLNVLLDAAAQALPSLPGLVLLLAGEGPERLALEEQARTLGISERVRFLGARADVPHLLRAAEGFVLPSCSEGISNALLEALSAGTPAIVSGIPGNLEVVRGSGGEDAALVVELDSVASLRDALLEVAGDAEGNARRVRAGRARLSAEFSFEAVGEAYETLFGRLAADPPPRRRRAFLRDTTRRSLPYAAQRGRFYAAFALGKARAVVSSAVVGVKRGLRIEGGDASEDSE